MTISTKIRQLTLPLLASVFMATSNASANTLPKVLVNNVTNGGINFAGPVQFSGYAGDTDGINEIYGTIQNRSNELFFSPNGTFVKEPTRLPFRFKKNAKETNWTTNAYALPVGQYLFRMRVEDGLEARTEIIAVPVKVSAAAAPVARTTAATAAPATQPAAQAPAAATVAGAKAANGMNYCGNAGTDADGDGFGWENNASCIVAGSKADKNPNCASAASDPDGDGWGWENERSCVVVTHCKSAGSDPDGDGFGWENERSCVVVKTSGKFAPCASASSDPDGDGYGWENNKTCLVAK